MNAKTKDLPAPTTEAIRVRIAEYHASIEAKEQARNQLGRDLGALVERSSPGDLAVARLRKSIADNEAELKELHHALGVLEQRLVEAVKREQVAAWGADFALSEAAGKAHIDAAAKLLAAVDAIVPAAVEVYDSDVEFIRSLRRVSNEVDQMLIAKTLSQRILLRLYVQTDGRIRPKGVLDSVHDLNRSDATDLVSAARDYVAVALRGAKNPPNWPDPTPPQAA